MGANVGLESVLFTIANHSGADFSATLQNPHHGGLVFSASLSNPALVFVGVHESGSATDKSFVYFHFAIGTAEFQERAVLHRKTDAMEHEPCGLLSDAKSATRFVGTDPVLAVGNHPNSNQPLVERKRRILKDSPDLDRELPFGVDALALPLALILEEHNIIATASRTDNLAVMPAKPNHELEAVVGVCEMDDCLLESLGLFHVLHLSQDYSSRSDLSSILLPLQKQRT